MEEDHTLDALLNLDEYIAELGKGYWVKIEAKKVKSSDGKPFGIKYSLTLHSASGERVIGMDNAHSVPGSSAKHPHDHIHRVGSIKKYHYKNASKLLEDFWKKVDSYICKEGY